MSIKRHSYLLFFALLAACAGTPASGPAPEWVTDMEKVYPASKYLAEKGTGAEKADAQIAGSRAIAGFISTQIDAQLREEFVAKNDGAAQTTITGTTIVTSQVGLAALKYSEPWYNRGDRQWEIAAYIERDEAWKVYEPPLRREERVVLNLYNAAEKENDPIRRLAMYRAAREYKRLNFDPMRRFAEQIHPQAVKAAFMKTDELLGDLLRMEDAARAQAVVFIDCPQDYENRVTQAFEKCINAEDFRVTKNRAEASAVFAITINSGESIQKDGDSPIYIFNPSLQAVLNGKSGPLFSYNPPAIERAVAYTESVGRRRAYTALAALVENSFPGEFRERLAGFARIGEN